MSPEELEKAEQALARDEKTVRAQAEETRAQSAAVRERQKALVATAERTSAEGVAAEAIEVVRTAAGRDLAAADAEAALAPALEARQAAIGARAKAVAAAKAELARFEAEAQALDHALGAAEAGLLQAITAARQEQARREREARAAKAREEAARAQAKAAKAAAARASSGRVRLQARIDRESDSNFFGGFSEAPSGVFIATLRRLKLGTPVELELSFDGKKVPLVGSVRFARDAGRLSEDVFPGVGIEVEDFPAELAAAVRRFGQARELMFFPD